MRSPLLSWLTGRRPFFIIMYLCTYVHQDSLKRESLTGGMYSCKYSYWKFPKNPPLTELELYKILKRITRTDAFRQLYSKSKSFKHSLQVTALLENYSRKTTQTCAFGYDKTFILDMRLYIMYNIPIICNDAAIMVTSTPVPGIFLIMASHQLINYSNRTDSVGPLWN